MIRLLFEDRWGRKVVGEYDTAGAAGKAATDYLKKEGIAISNMNIKTNPKSGNKEYISDKDFKFILVDLKGKK